MAVVGIARQRGGMQHEPAARRADIGDGDRDLHPELVGSAGLALGDALDLRDGRNRASNRVGAGVGSGFGRPAKARPRRRLDWPVPGDLAPDIADQAPQTGAQEAHSPVVAIELPGVGITS